MVVGAENDSHTYWVVPIRVANRDAVMVALREAGFDATARSSMLAVQRRGCESAGGGQQASWLQDVVFLPGCDDMPEQQWQKMISIVLQVAELPAAASAVYPSASLQATSELLPVSNVFGA